VDDINAGYELAARTASAGSEKSPGAVAGASLKWEVFFGRLSSKPAARAPDDGDQPFRLIATIWFPIMPLPFTASLYPDRFLFKDWRPLVQKLAAPLRQEPRYQLLACSAPDNWGSKDEVPAEILRKMAVVGPGAVGPVSVAREDVRGL
jgi:hypothetical protein